MDNIGKMVKCRCGKRFKKNTKWHEHCSTECKNQSWILKKAEEIKRDDESKRT